MFAPLSADDDRALADILPAQKHLARNHVLKNSFADHRVHVISTGWAIRSTTLRNGLRQITAFLFPGDICWPDGVDLENQEIFASSDVNIAAISRISFDNLLDRPNIRQAIVNSDRMDAAILRQWIVNIARRPAEPRVAHLILELQQRICIRGGECGTEFDLPLTQAHLGDALGLTSVHVNRTLKNLREAGLMTFRLNRVSIHKPDQLRALSEFNGSYLCPPYQKGN